jgi:uncharacterized membrane protein
MSTVTIRTLTGVAAVGSGVVAGVLLAFSTFVMKALTRIPSPSGLVAMQSINRFAPNPIFMVVLFGTAAVCLTLGGQSLTRLRQAGAIWAVAGCALYLAAIVITVTYHVPRNNALALVDPLQPGASAQWSRYASGWTAWNHIRTGAALAASAALTVALRIG